MVKIYGYVRVSTEKQSVESQRNVINDYVVRNRLILSEFIELEISSRKSTKERRIDELIGRLKEGDVIITSELSRLGRSIKEVLEIIDIIVQEKKCRFIAIKNNIDVDISNHKDGASKITITLFSMLAELEGDFIRERTKEGLRALKLQGVRLGKPVGKIQKSMFDKDREKILHLLSLGVSIQAIIEIHLGYGKYLALYKYIKKIKNARPEDLPIYKSA